MPLEEEKVIGRIAANIIEGYKKGGHTCVNCGQVSIPLIAMAEEFKPKVRDLVVREVGHEVKVGLCEDGYCPDCRWEKFGTGLDVHIVVRMNKDGQESPDQIVERLEKCLEGSGLTFEMKGFDRRYFRA